jgi:hypothetical protein
MREKSPESIGKAKSPESERRIKNKNTDEYVER